MNNLHRLHLVDAELARLAGNPTLAAEKYDAAIEAAHENGYDNDESLAHELAGRFHQSQGNAVVSRAYLMEARYAYQRWGASAKVRQLDDEFGEVLPRVEHAATGLDRRTRTGDAGESLDIQTVTKASQAISAEIHRDKLLENMMSIVIENAGAERGYARPELAGPRRWAAHRSTSHPVRRDGRAVGVPVSESRDKLSAGVVNYVLRTMESVVLRDAANEGDFTGRCLREAREPPLGALLAPMKHGDARRGVVPREQPHDRRLHPGPPRSAAVCCPPKRRSRSRTRPSTTTSRRDRP